MAKGKILIVEDESIVARMYQKSLTFDGFEVIISLNGKEGIKKAINDTPDLILLDIMMPKPDGMEVLDSLKGDDKTKDIPVVILTNLSGKNDAELALQKGAIDFWVKSNTEMEKIGPRIEKILNENSQ